jgi:D-cysteine desulfhydrase family pyridoxal phosphate-dependent enzyme
MQIGTLPRIRLGHFPTPLEEMLNLSKNLDGPQIFIKRDDLTGLGFGGNKTRKLEYIMADAQKQNADTIITGAGFQSNWCTQTACAAKKMGMDIILIKQGPKDNYDPKQYDGNHLLHFILDSDMKIVSSQDEHSVKIAEKLIKEGYKPYIIPNAGSFPLGVAGYINAMLEILSQSVQMGIKIDYIIHATGSGGTQAGLIMGAKAFNTGIKVLGINVSQSKKKSKIISKIITNSTQFFDIDLSLNNGDITVIDEYVGEGYGIIYKEVLEVINLVAETEGIFLDPVYTGKAMVGLIDLIHKNQFTKEDNVLFLHTGGAVALFPYKEPIKTYKKMGKLAWSKAPWSLI